MNDKFYLNGKETPFLPGQMILDAARNGGVEITNSLLFERLISNRGLPNLLCGS